MKTIYVARNIQEKNFWQEEAKSKRIKSPCHESLISPLSSMEEKNISLLQEVFVETFCNGRLHNNFKVVEFPMFFGLFFLFKVLLQFSLLTEKRILEVGLSVSRVPIQRSTKGYTVHT